MDCCEMGTYKCSTNAITPTGLEVFADKCLMPELQQLWAKGIRTMASCCGHGKVTPTILVAESDISKMEQLGYRHWYNPAMPEDKRGFVAKTI